MLKAIEWIELHMDRLKAIAFKSSRKIIPIIAARTLDNHFERILGHLQFDWNPYLWP